jgi:hypothetical protein
MSTIISPNQTTGSPFLSLPADLQRTILNLAPSQASSVCKAFNQLTEEKAQQTGRSILRALENKDYSIEENAGKYKDIRRIDLHIDRPINPAFTTHGEIQSGFLLDLQKIYALAPDVQELRLSGIEFVNTYRNGKLDSRLFKKLTSLAVDIEERESSIYTPFFLRALLRDSGLIQHLKITCLNQSAQELELTPLFFFESLKTLERLEINNFTLQCIGFDPYASHVTSIQNKLSYLKLNRSFLNSKQITLLRKGNANPNGLDVEESDPVLHIGEMGIHSLFELFKQLPEYVLFKTIAVFEKTFGKCDLSCKITELVENISFAYEELTSKLEKTFENIILFPIHLTEAIAGYFETYIIELPEFIKIIIGFTVIIIYYCLIEILFILSFILLLEGQL